MSARTATSNRQAMPVIASFVDELRAQGLTVKVLFAKENGVELGKQPAYSNVHELGRVDAPSSPR